MPDIVLASCVQRAVPDFPPEHEDCNKLDLLNVDGSVRGAVSPYFPHCGGIRQQLRVASLVTCARPYVAFEVSPADKCIATYGLHASVLRGGCLQRHSKGSVLRKQYICRCLSHAKSVVNISRYWNMPDRTCSCISSKAFRSLPVAFSTV